MEYMPTSLEETVYDAVSGSQSVTISSCMRLLNELVEDCVAYSVSQISYRFSGPNKSQN